MKRVMKMLVVSALCAGSLFAGDHSQKTFLMPRAAGTNKAMEYSIWHHHLYSKFDLKHSINSHLAITPFYQASTNDEDLGKYFGIGNCKTPKCIKFGDPSDSTVDLDSSFFIHNVDANTLLVNEFPTGTIQICPEQNVYGFRMDFFQSINCPCKGLFFKASLPFLHVETKTNIKFKDCNDNNKVTIGCHEASILDFFCGRVNITSDNTDDNVLANLQAPLKKAKICCNRSAQGVADLELMLGWKFLHNDKYHGFISGGVVIPTGNKVRGEYLFEPIYGNGDHFGLHLELDAGARLWKGDQGALKALAAISYRYLFSGTEMRTLGLKNICISSNNNDSNGDTNEVVKTTASKKFGHYALGGKIGQKAEQLFPLANVLSPNLRVKPGSQIDSQLWLSFQNSCFIVDVGYNLFWKDEESISLKKCPGFESDTYAIANPRFIVSFADPVDNTTFGDTPDDDFAVGTTLINECNLCIDAAKTPSQLTHKIFGALGWHFNLCKSYPTSLSVGGSYEFASDNSALEQWAVWAKAAFSF